jgi:hypothetical protein
MPHMLQLQGTCPVPQTTARNDANACVQTLPILHMCSSRDGTQRCHVP